MWSTICQTTPAGEKTGTLVFTVLYLHSLTCISVFVPGSSADTAQDQALFWQCWSENAKKHRCNLKSHRNLFQAGHYFVLCSLQFKMALFHQGKQPHQRNFLYFSCGKKKLSCSSQKFAIILHFDFGCFCRGLLFQQQT